MRKNYENPRRLPPSLLGSRALICPLAGGTLFNALVHSLDSTISCSRGTRIEQLISPETEIPHSLSSSLSIGFYDLSAGGWATCAVTFARSPPSTPTYTHIRPHSKYRHTHTAPMHLPSPILQNTCVLLRHYSPVRGIQCEAGSCHDEAMTYGASSGDLPRARNPDRKMLARGVCSGKAYRPNLLPLLVCSPPFILPHTSPYPSSFLVSTHRRAKKGIKLTPKTTANLSISGAEEISPPSTPESKLQLVRGPSLASLPTTPGKNRPGNGEQSHHARDTLVNHALPANADPPPRRNRHGNRLGRRLRYSQRWRHSRHRNRLHRWLHPPRVAHLVLHAPRRVPEPRRHGRGGLLARAAQVVLAAPPPPPP